MAEVTLQKVSKRYGEVSVIEDLDLEVGDGESWPRRALRLGNRPSAHDRGLEEISAGTIAIGGRVVNTLAPKDRDIAMVFQNYALYPHMTIRENLEFGLKMRKTPRAERERLVAEAAEVLEMADLLGRKPRQLSGGQRQRVALGRALVRHPAVFLFDEPLSNLDAKLRVQMRAEIKKLQRRFGTTAVYVTHDQIEAMTMGSRIAVMRDGRIQQVGEPLEIYQRPRNLFVANFIGTPPMNFLKARLDSEGTAVASGFTLTLPVEPPAPGEETAEIVLDPPRERRRRAEDGADGALPWKSSSSSRWETRSSCTGAWRGSSALQARAAPCAAGRQPPRGRDRARESARVRCGNRAPHDGVSPSCSWSPGRNG
jgi:multiple sugar transport system ATP-binding protein